MKVLPPIRLREVGRPSKERRRDTMSQLKLGEDQTDVEHVKVLVIIVGGAKED